MTKFPNQMNISYISFTVMPQIKSFSTTILTQNLVYKSQLIILRRYAIDTYVQCTLYTHFFTHVLKYIYIIQTMTFYTKGILYGCLL